MCPSCFKIFPVNEIAEHTDKCVDIWIGEVQVEDSENESETDTDLPDPGFIDAEPADTSLNNVAQEKWNLTANTPIRIVFLGEPAVDDGGPKGNSFQVTFQQQT